MHAQGQLNWLNFVSVKFGYKSVGYQTDLEIDRILLQTYQWGRYTCVDEGRICRRHRPHCSGNWYCSHPVFREMPNSRHKTALLKEWTGEGILSSSRDYEVSSEPRRFCHIKQKVERSFLFDDSEGLELAWSARNWPLCENPEIGEDWLSVSFLEYRANLNNLQTLQSNQTLQTNNCN